MTKKRHIIFSIQINEAVVDVFNETQKNKFVVRLVRNSTIFFLSFHFHFAVYSSTGYPQKLIGVFLSLLHTYASYLLESSYAAKILPISQAHSLAPFFPNIHNRFRKTNFFI